jgi:hypothetical protein
MTNRTHTPEDVKKIQSSWLTEERYAQLHTPQRTWVGLTDEDDIDWDGGDLKSLVRAVEAKLKEKNT